MRRKNVYKAKFEKKACWNFEVNENLINWSPDLNLEDFDLKKEKSKD